MVRVLVCGSRDYTDRAALFAYLDALHAVRPITCVIQGEARGADKLGKAWAISRGVEHEDYPADWKQHKRSAGPIRNRQMLREGKPEAVVAFFDHWPPDESSGTADMCRIAEAADLPVRRVPPAPGRFAPPSSRSDLP